MTTSEAYAQPAPDVRARIESALDAIRPALQLDGGDVEFVGFDASDGVAKVRLVGACGSCPISSMTMKQGIERRVRAAVPEVSLVEAVV